MRQICARGAFSKYRITDSQLNEARSETKSFSDGKRVSHKTTIFLSHKHNDLDDLKDIIGFLRRFNVEVYIDSMDTAMPKETSGETAMRIKNIIKRCDRFILLATDAAIESKWCNWELGFGDAHKYRDKIALFPLKEKNSYDYQYRGNEYMQIYPFIAYYDGTEYYKNRMPIEQGYYVCYYNEAGTLIIQKLEDWL